MHCFSPHACYIPCTFHHPWRDHPNYFWRRVQVMKLLTVQFTPASYHFIPHRSKYSPQHRVLKYL
jgi:hypothetical protein